MIQCQEQIRNVAWSPIKREIKSVGWQHEVHQTKYSNISKFPFLRVTVRYQLQLQLSLSKLPFLIRLFYSQATLVVCVRPSKL